MLKEVRDEIRYESATGGPRISYIAFRFVHFGECSVWFVFESCTEMFGEEHSPSSGVAGSSLLNSSSMFMPVNIQGDLSPHGVTR